MGLPILSQIVPALHPQVDAVGDYALNLAIQLRERYGVQTRFIVCDPDWDGPSRVEGFLVRRLRLRNEAGIWCLLAAVKDPRSSVMLHYSGHGYDKLGAPLWLYRGIKSWLMEASPGPAIGRKQFSTVFHELWISSPKPWKREFYLQLLQRHLVARIHRCSKVSVTNTLRMQRLLDGIKPGKTLWLPNPSNVPAGEQAQQSNRCTGPFRIAILGQANARCATLKAHANLLHDLDKKRQLSRVMLIGRGLDANKQATPETDLLKRSVSHSPVHLLDELSPADVSRSLRHANLFLSHCRGEAACKSPTLMAALASGCPAILPDGENAAPLNENEHFLASDDSPESVRRLEQTAAEGRLDRIGKAGRSWYHRYADWTVVAPQYQEALFCDALRPNPVPELSKPAPEQKHTWVPCPLTD